MKPDPANTRWKYSHPLAFTHCKKGVVLGSTAVLAFIGWLDYITGYEFGFFIFYFIPVALASWYCGRREGIAVAIGSAVCWFISDRFAHHPYSKAYFIYWEMFMRLISFLTTSLTLSRIRELVLNEERLAADLMAAQEKLRQFRASTDTPTQPH